MSRALPVLLSCAALAGGGCSGGGEPHPRRNEPAPGGRAAGETPASDASFQIRLWANHLVAGIETGKAQEKLIAAGRQSVPVLCELVPRASPSTRSRIAGVLERIGDPQAISALIPALSPEEPAVHHALCALSGKDFGARKADWWNWWQGHASALGDREYDEIRRAFLGQPMKTQQEILQGLSKELTRHAMEFQREETGSQRRPRQIDMSTEDDLRKRHAAVPVVDAVLEQGDPNALWYLPSLCRQIGRPAAIALRKGLHSKHPASRAAAAKILLDLGMEEEPGDRLH